MERHARRIWPGYVDIGNANAVTFSDQGHNGLKIE
jgi:hypothetical protein